MIVCTSPPAQSREIALSQMQQIGKSNSTVAFILYLGINKNSITEIELLRGIVYIKRLTVGNGHNVIVAADYASLKCKLLWSSEDIHREKFESPTRHVPS